ncbi:hypothetical protein FOZG_17405 [Fusarium oxysporum Fo47]|uniref:Sulfotransferase n=1 Tax=Fusarium oxysporum Fo47 TaxID=660027 RepID=W9JA80_FUSOX|nr:hypothetical protein FOZG_17405 [Fusarium oxysporum Fo47]
MYKTQEDGIRPVFVIGCPRSGTTLIGQFIATAPTLLNAGELSAMYFTHDVAEKEYTRVPSQYKAEYLSDLRAHSAQFMRKLCSREGKLGFVESTPWNMRVLPTLVGAFPEAVFVVCIRHYAGVIQSLRSSWEQGYKWAGPTDIQRAQLWTEMNGYIDRLPMDTTIFFSYDAMCRDPAASVSELEQQLRLKDVNGPFDRSVFADSHASSPARPKVASKSAEGKSEMQSISAYNTAAWSTADEAVNTNIAGACRASLASLAFAVATL